MFKNEQICLLGSGLDRDRFYPSLKGVIVSRTASFQRVMSSNLDLLSVQKSRTIILCMYTVTIAGDQHYTASVDDFYCAETFLKPECFSYEQNILQPCN